MAERQRKRNQEEQPEADIMDLGMEEPDEEGQGGEFEEEADRQEKDVDPFYDHANYISSDDDGNAVIKLRYPIKLGDGTTAEELRMRRMKTRDQMAVQQMGNKSSDFQKEIKLFTLLCDISSSELGNLDFLDYQALQRAYTGFLGR